MFLFFSYFFTRVFYSREGENSSTCTLYIPSFPFKVFQEIRNSKLQHVGTTRWRINYDKKWLHYNRGENSLHRTRWTLLTLDIADTGHCWHWTLLTMDIADTGHCWYWTLLTLDIADTGHCWHKTLQTLDIVLLTCYNADTGHCWHWALLTHDIADTGHSGHRIFAETW